MQRINNDIWLKLGPEDGDQLRFATIGGTEGEETLFSFDAEHAPAKPLPVGREALVLYNGPKGFLQQPVRITGTPIDTGTPIYRLVTTGDPVSAENREMFRVGMILSGHTATIGDGDEAVIADVSIMGLSVISERTYQMGEVVDVSFEVLGESYAGQCRVKSIKALAKGTRYGLLCLNGTDMGDLEKGLGKLTMEAQRAQLRRMSRAG